MALTEKQERFCLAYIETGNASEAYRRAYNAKKMKDTSLNVAASRLLKNAKVALRIAELRQPAIEKALYTQEMALSEASEALEVSREKQNGAAMVAAITLKSKLVGLLTEKVEVSHPAHESGVDEVERLRKLKAKHAATADKH